MDDVTVFERMDDGELQALREMLARWRGPGLIDPDLPRDPDLDRYSDGLHDWANEQLCHVVDEQDRRSKRPSPPDGFRVLGMELPGE